MKKFVVKRSQWDRGAGDDMGQLLNDKGKMCCLGFFCRQSGLSKKTINGAGLPEELYHNVSRFSTIAKKIPDLLYKDAYGCYNNSLLTNKVVAINDSKKLTDHEREQKLTKLFAKHDIEVVFKD